MNYSKGEFNFVVPTSTLDNLFKVHAETGARGVKQDRFHYVKIAIGVARELARDKKRQKDAKEVEAALAKMKLDLQSKIKDAVKVVDDADREVGKCEKQVQPLAQQAKAMAAGEMKDLANETDEVIQGAKNQVAEARASVQNLSGIIPEKYK